MGFYDQYHLYIYIYIYQYQYPWDLSKNALFPPNSWPSYGAKNYQYDGSPWVIGSWGHLAHLFQSRHRGETDETLDGCSVSLYRWMVYVMENQPTKMGWWLGYPHDNQKNVCVWCIISLLGCFWFAARRCSMLRVCMSLVPTCGVKGMFWNAMGDTLW